VTDVYIQPPIRALNNSLFSNGSSSTAWAGPLGIVTIRLLACAGITTLVCSGFLGMFGRRYAISPELRRLRCRGEPGSATKNDDPGSGAPTSPLRDLQTVLQLTLLMPWFPWVIGFTWPHWDNYRYRTIQGYPRLLRFPCDILSTELPLPLPLVPSSDTSLARPPSLGEPPWYPPPSKASPAA